MSIGLVIDGVTRADVPRLRRIVRREGGKFSMRGARAVLTTRSEGEANAIWRAWGRCPSQHWQSEEDHATAKRGWL
jgi:hypothetical protein